MRLFGAAAKRIKDNPSTEMSLGLFLFDEVNEALAAERVLRGADFDVKLVAPPSHLRAGCDLALTVPHDAHEPALWALSEADVVVRGWSDDTSGTRAVSDLVTTVDYGPWLMVRAGNMKIVVDKKTGIIVNTSGGGCPDIPYLSDQLIGQVLGEAPRPKEIGCTLCGLMLDRAYIEACAILGRRLR